MRGETRSVHGETRSVHGKTRSVHGENCSARGKTRPAARQQPLRARRTQRRACEPSQNGALPVLPHAHHATRRGVSKVTFSGVKVGAPSGPTSARCEPSHSG